MLLVLSAASDSPSLLSAYTIVHIQLFIDSTKLFSQIQLRHKSMFDLWSQPCMGTDEDVQQDQRTIYFKFSEVLAESLRSVDQID